MPHIELLDQITIDKIAAGEVIERPASVVKELVENAIDAGSTAVTVEIEEGGISLIRITDNGCGIAKQDVENAFLRHSTSKIRSAEDLTHLSSLGFRGEALSSISAVARVELITKTREDVFGTKYIIEGGKGRTPEETGAPDGTTFLVRQLFFNTPARRKFLKTPMTEASHISDLLTRLALSHPDISFRFINNGQVKLHTSDRLELPASHPPHLPVADLICGTDSRAFLLLYNLCSSVYKQFPCKGCPDSLSVAVLCIVHPVLIVP